MLLAAPDCVMHVGSNSQGQVALHQNPSAFSQGQVAHPNPMFTRLSRSRRQSKTYASDDSIEEEPAEYIDLDSAAKLAKAAPPARSRRKSRLSDCSVDESEPPLGAAMSRAMLPSLLKMQAVGSSDTTSSGVMNVSSRGVESTADQKNVAAEPVIDQRKQSLFRRFFSAVFACGAHPEMTTPPSTSDNKPSTMPSTFSAMPSTFSASAQSAPSDDNLSTGDASVSSSVATPATSSRRVSRTSNSAAVRIVASMNRALTRKADEAPPWTTGAQQLQGTAWSQPDEQELEAIQAQAATSTRNRVVEYMVRRGGTESSRKSLAQEKMPEELGTGVQEAQASVNAKVGQPPWLAAKPVSPR